MQNPFALLESFPLPPRLPPLSPSLRTGGSPSRPPRGGAEEAFSLLSRRKTLRRRVCCKDRASETTEAHPHSFLFTNGAFVFHQGGGEGGRRQQGDVVGWRGLPDRRRRRAGPLGDVLGGHCHLQQVPHQHPWLLLRDDADELAPDGDLLHTARRAAAALLRGEADGRADRHLLRVAQWHLHWPPQPLPGLQLSWLLPDDQAGHYTIHHAVRNHLFGQEVQPEHQGLSHGPAPGSWHRVGHRSPAQSPRLDHRSAHHRRDVCQPDSDQPNPEEAQGVLHPAPVPVLPVPVRRAARHRPVRRQASDEARRLRVQLHLPSRGVHRAVVLDRGERQLQHVPGDRDDVARDVPGAGSPQDVPHPLLRLRPAQGPLHVPERRRHPRRHLRHGPLLLLLRLREPEESRGQLAAGIHPDGREGLGAASWRREELAVAGEQGGRELRRRAEDGEEHASLGYIMHGSR